MIIGKKADFVVNSINLLCLLFWFCLDENSSDTTTYDGQLKDDDHLGDTGRASAIRLLPMVGNTKFHVTSTMLHLLQMKGMFGGQSYEVLNMYLNNFISPTPSSH